jgi:hypothetical protein
MRRGRARLPQLRLSLGQMMKLVIFAAAACASVAPMAQLYDVGVIHDVGAVVIWSAVAAPLACAVAAFPLVRGGPFKDWLIRALLANSVAVALGFAIHLLTWSAILWFRGGSLYGFSFLQTAAVVTVLSFALVVLLRRVIPGWCPACRSPTLIPDLPVRDGPRNAFRCLVCDGQFQKRDGAWKVVAADAVARWQHIETDANTG